MEKRKNAQRTLSLSDQAGVSQMSVENSLLAEWGSMERLSTHLD
jgi:lambda repressor-like predicted transcriptional regulator